MTRSWRTVRLLEDDVNAIDKLRIHETEPTWSVVRRAIVELKKKGKRR